MAFCSGVTSKQRRKAWGTNNVEKGMLGLGEGAQGLEDVASEEDEAVRESPGASE